MPGELLPDGTRRDTRSSTERQLTKILYVLIEVFETMRQSYPGGFCTAQLAFNYNKKIKKFLAKEWNERLSGLKDELGEQARASPPQPATRWHEMARDGTRDGTRWHETWHQMARARHAICRATSRSDVRVSPPISP